MKIVHLSSARQFRGGEGQVLALCTGLVERGHDALLVAQPGSPLAERARAAGVAVIELRMRTEFDLVAARRIRRLVRDSGAAVLHCHTGMAHGLGWLATGGLGWLASPSKRPWKLVVTRRVVRPIRRGPFSRAKYLRGVDHFVAISQAVRRQLLSYGLPPDRVSLVPSAAVEPEQTPAAEAPTPQMFGITADDFVIGTIGALEANKDQRTLVAAAGLLHRRGRAFKLLIVGGGELRAALEAQAQREGIADVTTFTGAVEDIRPLLRRMNVLAMPSVREGLGSVVLRAFEAGVPVVASDAGGLPEIVRPGETGALFSAGDAEALVRELERLMDNPAPRAIMENARRLVEEHFQPAHMVEGNLAVYRRMLDERVWQYAEPLVVRNGARTVYVQPEWRERLAGVDLHDAARHAPRAPGLAGRGDLGLIELDGARLLCKRMQHGGLLAGLLGSRYLDRRKPLHELRIVGRALARGVPTAQVPAVVVEYAMPPFYRYWVFSHELPDTVDLLSYLRRRPPRRERLPVIAAAARAVCAMHDARLFHADLHLKNILVRVSDLERPEAFVIDFDKATLVGRMSVRKRLKNLRRLWKSAEKARAAGFGITPSDMVRFLVEYAGDDLPCYRERLGRTRAMRWHRWRYRHEVLTVRPK
jgi:glycosyltransferase involved in cell wall biosynthesis